MCCPLLSPLRCDMGRCDAKPPRSATTQATAFRNGSGGSRSTVGRCSMRPSVRAAGAERSMTAARSRASAACGTSACTARQTSAAADTASAAPRPRRERDGASATSTATHRSGAMRGWAPYQLRGHSKVNRCGQQWDRLTTGRPHEARSRTAHTGSAPRPRPPRRAPAAPAPGRPRRRSRARRRPRTSPRNRSGSPARQDRDHRGMPRRIAARHVGRQRQRQREGERHRPDEHQLRPITRSAGPLSPHPSIVRRFTAGSVARSGQARGTTDGESQLRLRSRTRARSRHGAHRRSRSRQPTARRHRDRQLDGPRKPNSAWRSTRRASPVATAEWPRDRGQLRECRSSVTKQPGRPLRVGLATQQASAVADVGTPSSGIGLRCRATRCGLSAEGSTPTVDVPVASQPGQYGPVSRSAKEDTDDVGDAARRLTSRSAARSLTTASTDAARARGTGNYAPWRSLAQKRSISYSVLPMTRGR